MRRGEKKRDGQSGVSKGNNGKGQSQPKDEDKSSHQKIQVENMDDKRESKNSSKVDGDHKKSGQLNQQPQNNLREVMNKSKGGNDRLSPNRSPGSKRRQEGGRHDGKGGRQSKSRSPFRGD